MPCNDAGRRQAYVRVRTPWRGNCSIWAWSNLLANAIEHGGGAITIRTVLNDGRVRVEVTDGGPGLPASIAELTRRPSAGRGARRRGRGRGLAIAQSVLRHCGGRLSASADGPGVAIELPIAERAA